MKSIKYIERKIKILENKKWVSIDINTAKKEWYKLNGRLSGLKDVLKFIDKKLTAKNINCIEELKDLQREILGDEIIDTKKGYGRSYGYPKKGDDLI